MGAKSTDHNKLTVNQRFCHSDFVVVILSQSEGLGKMALVIVKYFQDRSTQPIRVVRGQFVTISCHGPLHM